MYHNYKLIFTIRFIGYFLFIMGITSALFIFGPIANAEFDYRSDQVLGIKHTILNTVTSKTLTSTEQATDSASFGQIVASVDDNTAATTYNPTDGIIPVSTEFGIVIEKINANAKIIPNVDASNEKEYTKALSEGVAQALGSTAPGQPGNLYLFSHSTNASWNVVRYNAIFYLLRELEEGDRVVIFYQNKRYNYTVFDKTIVSANDTTFLTKTYDEPVLTMQTCDPPGTLFKRLIVRAKLVRN